MKKVTLLLAVLTLMLVIFASCSSEPKDEPAQPVEEPENEFVEVESLRLSARQKQVASIANDPAIAMLIEAEKHQLWNIGSEELVKDGNILLSPMSLSAAMAMIANGANGETRSQMLQVLWNGATLSEVNELYAKLLDDGTRLDKDVTLNLANSIWAKEDVAFKPDFVNAVSAYYLAPISHVNFALPEAKKSISKWCSDATHGKITFSTEDTHWDAMVIMAINALYFKGEWAQKFDAKLTADAPFYSSLGETQTVKMMQSKGHFKKCEDEKACMVQLDYGKGKYYIDLIMPVGNTDIHSYLLDFNLAKLNQMESELSAVGERKLMLPRLSLSQSNELTRCLTAMGITDAFDNRADFSNMATQADTDEDRVQNISDVSQTISIDFTEEGSEAAATTIVEWEDSASGSASVVRFDHPFLFLLRERESGAIILAGKVVTMR